MKKAIVLLAPKILRTDIEQTRFSQIESDYFFFNLNPCQDKYKKAQELAQNTSSCACFCYGVWKNPQQITLIQSLLKTKKPLILLSVKDPIGAHLFSDADALITTFSPAIVSIKAAYEKM
ncbi:hypothetical protein RHABOEDO_000725 [Candidatus Rhabdochlamydia oedothoracis]|uniref:Uncharacterized protein n=1 Tax=Candidatus Rhabdochlamydia oedothoracis TaxID=2720720 RepID=A0ABX8V009_9BACT|nr:MULTISPECIES: hypothetical protein [Rhabdochlamydia]KAG6559663.1 hypothetical protein RHOW815_000333 [Candidatus Rhabdochlamydia sp. W815]QYF48543.1 hypothetical protein RHABOEDO_000725 [Candidatus Rhabdochlamydia oedothoracis]